MAVLLIRHDQPRLFWQPADTQPIDELDPFDHITAGYSVECGSDAAAMRAARTLLERSTGVEVWKSNHCMAT